MSARYRVAPGKRVIVGGKAYTDGATFSAEPTVVTMLLRRGWISEVTGKAVHADQVEDKAVATPRRRSPRQPS